MTAISHYSLQWIWNLEVIWTFATECSINITLPRIVFLSSIWSELPKLSVLSVKKADICTICARTQRCCCASANRSNSQFYLSNKSSGISAAILNKPNVAFYVGFLKFLSVNNGWLQQINRMFTWSNRYLRSQKSLWQVKLPYPSAKLLCSRL